MELEAFVAEYGASIEAGQASLLVGAGISNGAGYPTWDELLAPVAEEFGVPAMDDLPLQAQYIENHLGGRNRLMQHLVDSIGSVGPCALENHTLIAELGIRDTWTTNYDPLLETADPEAQVISKDDELLERAPASRRLHKMHGSIPHGASEPVGGSKHLVLSRRDYENYESTHPRLWRLLQARFLTSSFLFLGFSLTDPNFEAVFRLARQATPDRLMRHYAIMRRPPTDPRLFELAMADLESAGVTIIEIEQYEEITEILRRLVARTRPASLFVSGSARTPDDEQGSRDADYPTAAGTDELDTVAEMLGARLAHVGVPGLVAAGELGAKVGYRYLAEVDDPDPSRFVLVRRQRDEDLGPPSRRQGQIHFTGGEPGDMRSAVFEKVRAVIVVGGGPGTLGEVRTARDKGMTVVPLPRTGGAARQVWTEIAKALGDHQIGQQPIDPDAFAKLDSADQGEAIQAAVELVQIGLFMPSV